MISNLALAREKIQSDHKEELEKMYFTATGEVPSEEIAEKMVSGCLKLEVIEGQRSLHQGAKRSMRLQGYAEGFE
ncbi:hypothetical protein Nepgr_008166 [Nepenthes gracilis]|uniref:Uncharacterized protein n=1 Tax=Nepenthes gracilis TaxID=150966 RepID=A0AAD3S8K2_NEPGR|nr:hypothetical protein Nepgr_008166 [Nepenthes gracilis]